MGVTMNLFKDCFINKCRVVSPELETDFAVNGSDRINGKMLILDFIHWPIFTV